MAGKVYTYQEIVKHNNLNDCWVLIHGKVYNVTDFLEEHPGGEILTYSAGKDATNDFEESGHSSEAREQMKDFYIGVIDKSTIPEEENTKRFDASTPSFYKNQVSSKILISILPLLILGVAFIMRFYA